MDGIRKKEEKETMNMKNKIQDMKIYQCCFRFRSMVESSLTGAMSLNASSLAILVSHHVLFVAAFAVAISRPFETRPNACCSINDRALIEKI